MRILWAVSSVGKGHILRDIAIVKQLQKMAEIEVDWLAPNPAGDYLMKKGYRVLECSTQLEGSGTVYEKVFEKSTYEFNLINYIRADTKLHKHDFDVSNQCWKGTSYDVIVGDEAFWLLTGFSANPSLKPAPFIFITDFIGINAMRPRVGDFLSAWQNNLMFTMSYWGPDVYIYIGNPEEIPSERFGFLLPHKRRWAQQHCRFMKPIVNFDTDLLADTRALRKNLGLPGDRHIFLAVVGPEGNTVHRTACIEKTLALVKKDYPDACFILVGPVASAHGWIQYHRYLENLFEYFAVSSVVLVQSGYGKVVELSALGIPFIAIPLDYHFEQEYVMANRLKHYEVGKLVELRNYSPYQIAREVKGLVGKQVKKISVDNGAQMANIIISTARKKVSEK